MRISDWSSDVCSSDLWNSAEAGQVGPFHHGRVVRRALGDVQGDQEVLVGPERGAPPPSVPVRQRRVDRVPWELMERCMALPVKVAHAAQEGMRRSEEHTSELQSLMRISYAVFCLK